MRRRGEKECLTQKFCYPLQMGNAKNRSERIGQRVNVRRTEKNRGQKTDLSQAIQGQDMPLSCHHSFHISEKDVVALCKRRP